jgi:hypothetical protein
VDIGSYRVGLNLILPQKMAPVCKVEVKTSIRKWDEAEPGALVW